MDIHPIGPDMVLEWQSVVGRTYFLQVSGGLAPTGTGPALLTWAWADVIEEGHGGPISYEFGGDAPHGFARLHYTDAPRPPGVSLEEWDTDGDGRSNAAEINGNPQSNPLLYSTSGTGIADGWAVAHGLDPNDPTIGGAQFQQTGLTNLQAKQAGVQAHPDATLNDRDGDLVKTDEDADPDDRVIDWKPGAHPSFAVIELDVDRVEELRLDDLAENGTVLLTRSPLGEPSTRLVIDSAQVVHAFDFGYPTPIEGRFGGFGQTLIGVNVPGFRSVGESFQECLWDPAANTFTPWQSPTGYHSDLLDERDGLLIGQNWLNHPSDPGLRRSPDGDFLPEDETLGSNYARIEANGNVLSNKAYWRKGPGVGPPSPFEHELQAPVVLPGSSWTASATLEQSGNASTQKWNIVAGWGGVLVSKNDGPFIKPSGSLSGVFASGATRQGWIVDQVFDQIWANGELHDLKDCLGDPQIVEATLMGILDTGLAVARIRRANGPLKLALLLPVEVVIPKVDETGNEVSGELVAANELKVAKMEYSLTVEKNAGEITKEELDIEKDVDRFYVRMIGGAALANGREVSVKLKTADNAKAKYNDDETEIKLAVENADLISKSLMLTTDHVDDDFAGEVEVGEDNQEGDRTHIIQLGGNLVLSKLKLGDDEYDVNLVKPVQKKKIVTVNFVILDDGNINVANVTSEIESDIEVMNERYAQVGIEVVSAGISTVPTPAGIELPANELVVNQLTDRVLSNECKAVIDACGTVGNVNDMHVVYSPYQLTDRRGDPLDGIALTDYFHEDPGDAGYLSNALITIGQPLKIALGHEIGHLLYDKHVENLIAIGDPNVQELWIKRRTNLMTADPEELSDTRISGSRRLWKVQESQMRASIHSKDP